MQQEEVVVSSPFVDVVVSTFAASESLHAPATASGDEKIVVETDVADGAKAHAEEAAALTAELDGVKSDLAAETAAKEATAAELEASRAAEAATVVAPWAAAAPPVAASAAGATAAAATAAAMADTGTRDASTR